MKHWLKIIEQEINHYLKEMDNNLIWIPVKKEYKKKAKAKFNDVEWQFEKDVCSFLVMKWYERFHVPDSWLWTKLLDEIVFSPDGRQFVIEFKQVEWYTFNLNKFEPNQIRLLEYMMKHWHEAYVMIYSQAVGNYWVGDYKYLKENANSQWWVKLFAKI